MGEGWRGGVMGAVLEVGSRGRGVGRYLEE